MGFMCNQVVLILSLVNIKSPPLSTSGGSKTSLWFLPQHQLYGVD